MKAVNLGVDTIVLATPYDGLYGYGAEELGIVRTFVRLARRYYEGQTRRFERVTGELQDPTDA